MSSDLEVLLHFFVFGVGSSVVRYSSNSFVDPFRFLLLLWLRSGFGCQRE